MPPFLFHFPQILNIARGKVVERNRDKAPREPVQFSRKLIQLTKIRVLQDGPREV